MDRWLSFIVDKKVSEAGLAWDERSRGYRVPVAMGGASGGGASGAIGGGASRRSSSDYDTGLPSTTMYTTNTTTTTMATTKMTIVCSPDESERLDRILQFWQRFYRKRQCQMANAMAANLHRWITAQQQQQDQGAGTGTATNPTPSTLLLVIPQKHLFTVERCLMERHGWKRL